MAIWKAEKTLAAIHYAIMEDGGNRFRWLEGQAFPLMSDAYRADEDARRSHMGASQIGKECDRSLWYGFRWFSKFKPRGRNDESDLEAGSRMIRLWNRGHLEEARFLALLWLIGCTIYQQDAEGKQFRIAEFGGHFGGSGDSIAYGVPELPHGIPALSEYKTHGAKSFAKLIEHGVQMAKPEHYTQMQVYMYKFGLQYALYLAVNKDTDDLWAEIIILDPDIGKMAIERAGRIIFAEQAPKRVRYASPGFTTCRFCDDKDVCFGTVAPERNCRTCNASLFGLNGGIVCTDTGEVLDKAKQKVGCQNYRVHGAYR